MSAAAHPVDLHTLANLPGAGRAAEALASAGLRLPPGVPEDCKLFRVTVDVTVTRSGIATLIIAAEDEDTALYCAAEVEAEELVGDSHDAGVKIGRRHAKAVSTAEPLQIIRTEGLTLRVDE